MRSLILLILLAMININTLLAQKPGIYKVQKDTAEATDNLYEIVGKNGKELYFEPYKQTGVYSGKDRIRFRINPKLNDSENVTTYLQRVANPPEVEDFINCLSTDFTSNANKILGVWYYKISGIKCYKVFAPTRSLLLFVYEQPDGNFDTANAILEAVNYGNNQVVAEDGIRYSIAFKDNDTIIASFIVEGKKHQEKWVRCALPSYFLNMF